MEIHDKLGILDVKLTTKNKKIIDIEIQIKHKSNMKQRVLFYVSRMITDQIGESESYEKIQKVVNIVICTDHKMIKDSKNYHNRYLLHDKENDSTFTDLLEVNILEPQKISNDDKSKLSMWLKFLNTNNEEELEMCAQASPELREAVCIYKKLTSDENTRLKIRMREDAVRDYYADMGGMREEGIAEGIEIGKIEGKIEIARNLLKANVDINIISNSTGLTAEEIEKIRKV
jgi:predicted transposase/invertase (TIGR01784 family)